MTFFQYSASIQQVSWNFRPAGYLSGYPWDISPEYAAAYYDDDFFLVTGSILEYAWLLFRTLGPAGVAKTQKKIILLGSWLLGFGFLGFWVFWVFSKNWWIFKLLSGVKMGFRSRSMVFGWRINIDPNVEAAWVVGFWVSGQKPKKTMGLNASPAWDTSRTSYPPVSLLVSYG